MPAIGNNILKSSNLHLTLGFGLADRNCCMALISSGVLLHLPTPKSTTQEMQAEGKNSVDRVIYPKD